MQAILGSKWEQCAVWFLTISRKGSGFLELNCGFLFLIVDQLSPAQVTTVIVRMECIFYLSWQSGYCLSFQVQAILWSKWEQCAMWFLTWWQHQQCESIGWVKRTIERRHHYFQRQSRLDCLQAGLHSFVELHVHFWFLSLSLWFKIYMELSTANQS